MISDRMQKDLNKQINKEIYSAYLYLAMSASASAMNFKGAAHWLKVQFDEEMGHALKFYKYLIDQCAAVDLQAIARPPADYKSLLDIFAKVLEHEKQVTASINALADLAAKEKDYATGIALQWFVTEQIEEEANATEIVAQLKFVGDKAGSIFMVDHQLSKRKGAGA